MLRMTSHPASAASGHRGAQTPARARRESRRRRRGPAPWGSRNDDGIRQPETQGDGQDRQQQQHNRNSQVGNGRWRRAPCPCRVVRSEQRGEPKSYHAEEQRQHDGIEKIAIGVGHLCEGRARPEQRAVLRRRADERQVSRQRQTARRHRQPDGNAPVLAPPVSQQLPHRQRATAGHRSSAGRPRLRRQLRDLPSPANSAAVFGRPASRARPGRSFPATMPYGLRLERVFIACRDARNQQRHGPAGQADVPPGEKPKHTQPSPKPRSDGRRVATRPSPRTDVVALVMR